MNADAYNSDNRQSYFFKSSKSCSKKAIYSHYTKLVHASQQRNETKRLTVSFLTVMKLILKFFLDSKSDNSCFRSDLVNLLSTPASSTIYESFGGPSLTTSNSDASALPVCKSGLKLSAKVRARAARPCWA